MPTPTRWQINQPANSCKRAAKNIFCGALVYLTRLSIFVKNNAVMAYELKRIKVLGYTTDFQSCDCCGKENLAGTVAILDLDHDVKLHFGTTCAAKADKYDTYDAFRAAKKEINAAVNADRDRKTTAGRIAFRLLRKAFGSDTDAVTYTEKLKCSECCYQDVYAQCLAHIRTTGSLNIELKAEDAKPRYTAALLIIDLPAQWTGINRSKK